MVTCFSFLGFVVSRGGAETRLGADFLMSILHGYYVRTVLDCGCGTGLFAFYLQEYGISVTGLDASEPTARLAGIRLRFEQFGQALQALQNVLI